MTPEEEKAKKIDFEEAQFKKRWAKHLKLSPIYSRLKANVGRAPKCGSHAGEIKVAVDTKATNKKKR